MPRLANLKSKLAKHTAVKVVATKATGSKAKA